MLSAMDYLQDQHYEVTMDSWLRSFVGDTIKRGSDELANKEPVIETVETTIQYIYSLV